MSYWKIGGLLENSFFPTSLESLIFLVTKLHELNEKFIIVGKSSNLLFTSEYIRGIVIFLGENFSNIEELSPRCFRVLAGTSVPWMCYVMGARGYSGVEHCIGIPGSLGGLIYMNGGSNRKAIGEVVTKVTAINAETGKLLKLSRNECGFSYRKSFFQDTNLLIISADIELVLRPSKEVKKEMLYILKSRKNKFPLNFPNCGSVFKSSPEIYKKYGPPGKIIEDMGLKGTTIGGASISEKHANFIINHYKATSEEVFEIINLITQEFYKKSGLFIRTEVSYVDSSCNIINLSEYMSEIEQH